MRPRLSVLALVVIIGSTALARFHDAPAIRGNLAVGIAASHSAVEDIETPAGPGSAEPNLAVDPDGRVYLSWLEPVAAGHALRVARLDGRSWSDARTIREGSDFFVNWADFPSVEVLADGRLAAHWLQRTGAGTYAYGVRIALSIDDGRSWSAPIVPHRDSSETEHGFVSLWRDGAALGAAWLDGRKFDKGGHSPTKEMMLASTVIGTSGRRGAETHLDDRVCDCCQTSAALTSAGPVLVYRDRSPDEIRDIAIVRRVRGVWTKPVLVHRDNWRINACPVNGPAIDTRANRVAVAWFTAANDSPRVNVAFSTDAGARFAPPTRADEGQPAGRVDVIVLGDGSALVSWIERSGGDTAEVKVRRVYANGRTGRAMTIATSSAARASGFPRLVASGASAIFAWTQPGRPSQVRLARIPLTQVR